MKIYSFTIQNYRSITNAYKVHMDNNLTVLVGKNNEGKSNVLRALSGAFRIISLLRIMPKEEIKNYIFDNPRRYLHRRDGTEKWTYLWDRDFPVSKQDNKNNLHTIFRLDFVLSDNEIAAFKKEIGHNFNKNLPFEIILSRNDMTFKIPKRAYGGQTKNFNAKVDKIASFISSRLDSIYIPSVRPADLTLSILNDLFSSRIRQEVKVNKRYEAAMNTIDSIYKEETKKMQLELKPILTKFIPSISSIEINSDSNIFRSDRSIREIKIDDGVNTSIFEKGEGLQSLISLALMQQLRKSSAELTLAIDEPESHLHPEAVREVKESLLSISDTGQVIIATHSPILVNRDNLSANIIVSENKAIPVKRISEIRNILGVSVSDNLVNAEYVLIVEGPTDADIFKHVLYSLSPTIKNFITQERLIIKPTLGVKNFCSEKSWLNTFLCTAIFCYLDNDDAAINVTNEAKLKRILAEEELLLIKVPGKKESELEDMIYLEFYQDLLPQTLTDWKKYMNNKNKKWSDNISDLFNASGKTVPLETLKNTISNRILQQTSFDNILDKSKRTTLNALIATIENKLESAQ